jgi:hypothetical protein
MKNVSPAGKAAAPAAPVAAKVAAPDAPKAIAQGAAMLAGMAASTTTPEAQRAAIAKVAGAEHLQALPKHLAAKVASVATGGTQIQVPAKLVGLTLTTGKAHKARAPAEQVWANFVQREAAKGISASDLLQKGASIALGAHSILAYIQRGWLVASK